MHRAAGTAAPSRQTAAQGTCCASWPATLAPPSLRPPLRQVTQLLGRPLHRQLAAPTGLEALEAGWGMSICQPPQPRGVKGHLAFVAARLGEGRGSSGGGAGCGSRSSRPSV